MIRAFGDQPSMWHVFWDGKLLKVCDCLFGTLSGKRLKWELRASYWPWGRGGRTGGCFSQMLGETWAWSQDRFYLLSWTVSACLSDWEGRFQGLGLGSVWGYANDQGGRRCSSLYTRGELVLVRGSGAIPLQLHDGLMFCP